MDFRAHPAMLALGEPSASLPSGDAALAWVRGEPGGLAHVLGTTAMRAALIAAGLLVARAPPEKIIGYSVAGATAVELSVLAWALRRARAR